MNWSWSRCIKSQESPRSDIFRKRATKPLLKQKHCQKHLTWAKEKNNWPVAQWSKVLFSDESTFCISFVNQGPRVCRKSVVTQNPCCLKSSVKFPQSVMIWAANLGWLCFLKSTVNAAIYQEMLEHFMLHSSDKMYKNKGLKYFNLRVIHLYSTWVSLSELSDKKWLTFFMIFNFF